MKIKKGDIVKIMAGKDKGKDGKVEIVIPKEGKVIMPGINMYKKHVKGVGEVKGGIYDLPRAMDISKLALICTKCKKITRVGYKTVGDKKLRICRKCQKEI